MKSGMPKVLHTDRRPAAARPRPGGRRRPRSGLHDRRRRPSGRTSFKAALRSRPDARLRGPGAAAGHRPRPAAGRPGSAAGRHGAAAVRRRAAADARPRSRRWSARIRAGAAATVLTARRPPYGYGRIVRAPATSCESSRSGTRRRRSARSGKSTRHLRVRARPAVRRASRASRRDNAQGEYYLPDLVAHLPAARARRRRP